MANQEGGVRRGIFGINAPTREVPIPVLPKPQARPSPEAPLKPKKGKEKKGIGKGVKRALITGAALTALGGAGYASYENIPAVHQAVDSAFLDHIRGKSSFTEVSSSEVFDNTVTEGVITDKNIVRLPQEEIDRQFPNAFGKLNDGKNTLAFQLPLDISSSSKPNVDIKYTKEFGGSGQAEREALSSQGYNDIVTFYNVPGGTRIVAPMDGFLLISNDHTTDQKRPPNGTADVQTALIEFVAPNGNHYRLSIVGATEIRSSDPRFSKTAYTFRNLTDASEFDPKLHNNQVIGKFGKAVKKGNPILEIIQPANGNPVDVGIFIGLAREGKIGEATNMLNPSIPTNIELFTSSDGKLISSSE